MGTVGGPNFLVLLWVVLLVLMLLLLLLVGLAALGVGIRSTSLLGLGGVGGTSAAALLPVPLLGILLESLLGRVSHLETEGLVLNLDMETVRSVALNGGLEAGGRSLEGGWDVGTLQLDVDFDILRNLDEGLELHLVEVRGSAGLSHSDVGLSEHGSLGDILNLVVNLDTSRSLLRAGVRLSNGFTDETKSSVLWHGGRRLVGSPATGNSDESRIHIRAEGGDGQVLEDVLGVLVVNFVDGRRLLGDGLDDASLSGDGGSEDESVREFGSSLNGSLLGVGVGGGAGS